MSNHDALIREARAFVDRYQVPAGRLTRLIEALELERHRVDILRGVLIDGIGMMSGVEFAPPRASTCAYVRERFRQALEASDPRHDVAPKP